MEEKKNNINQLLVIMQRLRDPQHGCPWDRQQTFASIAPYTIEEAYEVEDAIRHGDTDDIKQELGDLLFQVVFYAQMGEEQLWFNFEDIVEAICDKLIRRHPHVFAGEKIDNAQQQTDAWERHKREERQRKGHKKDREHSVLDGIPVNLPALTRSVKLQNRAAREGFDWPDVYPVFDKINEELQEVKTELQNESPDHRVLDEVGDVLFAVTNLARHLNIDPEAALRHANDKFVRRFQGMEKKMSDQEQSLSDLSLDELESLWQSVKSIEKF